jgi:hypothetical protein
MSDEVVHKEASLLASNRKVTVMISNSRAASQLANTPKAIKLLTTKSYYHADLYAIYFISQVVCEYFLCDIARLINNQKGLKMDKEYKLELCGKTFYVDAETIDFLAMMVDIFQKRDKALKELVAIKKTD